MKRAAGALSDQTVREMRQVTVKGALQGTIPCPGGAEIVLLVRVPVGESVEVGSDE